MIDYGKYIGIPFVEFGRDMNGWDCYGLIHFIFSKEYGVEIDSLENAQREKIDYRKEVESGDWEQVENPEEKCVIVLSVLKFIHVGLMVSNYEMLHCIEPTGTTLERIDGILWRRRIQGFYRSKRSIKPVSSIVTNICD